MPLQCSSLIAFLTFAGFCCAQTTPTPGPSAATADGTGIEGVITISPTRPGPIRLGEQGSGPLPNVTFVVSGGTSAAAEFTTDKEGHFRISLPPGHYRVTKKDQQSKIGRFGPFEVDVVPGQMTKVTWGCDSGMR